MVKLCPKCGATSDRKRFIGSFCIECYPVNIVPPGKVIVHICKDCGKMRLRSKWMQYSIERIERFIANRTRGSFEHIELDIKAGKVKYIMKIDNQLLEIEKPIRILLKKELCDECTKRRGGYYEAIIQIRGLKQDVKKIKKKIIKMLSRKAYVSREVETRTGIDIYISNKQAVVEVLSSLKLRYLRTRTLHTVREGKRVYRDTFLVRL